MIDDDIFRERAMELYASQRKMAAAVKEDGVIIRPKIPLPFTRDEFELWLWRKVGATAIRCPYECGVVIDALNCTIDHMIPRGQDGSFALENLTPCCVGCNTLKGNMTAVGFRLLMGAGREMPPKDWELLRKRIIIGGQAQQLKWRNIKLQREKGKAEKTPTVHRAAGTLRFDNDPDF
jgi:hypothetical protein